MRRLEIIEEIKEESQESTPRSQFSYITKNNVDESDNEEYSSTKAEGKAHKEPSLLNELIHNWKKPKGASGWKGMHQTAAETLWKSRVAAPNSTSEAKAKSSI